MKNIIDVSKQASAGAVDSSRCRLRRTVGLTSLAMPLAFRIPARDQTCAKGWTVSEVARVAPLRRCA